VTLECNFPKILKKVISVLTVLALITESEAPISRIKMEVETIDNLALIHYLQREGRPSGFKKWLYSSVDLSEIIEDLMILCRLKQMFREGGTPVSCSKS